MIIDLTNIPIGVAESYRELYILKSAEMYKELNKMNKKHNFIIIEECPENMLLERETYWKNYYKVLDQPSLCCRIDGKGGKNSNETKLKMSISAKKAGMGKWNI